MRDLRTEEMTHVYGAGGKGKSYCKPVKCHSGKGSKSKGSKSKGSKSKGSKSKKGWC